MALINSDIVSLSSFQRLKIRLYGQARIGYAKKTGWKEQIPLFAFNCETHGVVINTPQGHMQRLLCPRCFDEEIASTFVVDYQMQQLDDIYNTALVEGN